MMLADVSGLIGELSAMSEAEVPAVPVLYVLGRLKGGAGEKRCARIGHRGGLLDGKSDQAHQGGAAEL